MSVRIVIKNWAKFQHFKDRRPPWVKLYRELLDDREWHKLDGESAKMLVSLWLIGSENSGELPGASDIAFRLRIDETTVTKCLKRLGHWLISERYQGDISLSQKISVADIEMPLREREETETETETETKKETETDTPVGISTTVWQDFQKHRKAKKAPITETVMAGIKREADKAGWALENALIEICARGWTGFNAEWVLSDKQKPQPETFKERDARLGREKWERMTGEQHPDNNPVAPTRSILDVVDVEIKILELSK